LRDRTCEKHKIPPAQRPIIQVLRLLTYTIVAVLPSRRISRSRVGCGLALRDELLRTTARGAVEKGEITSSLRSSYDRKCILASL